MPGDLAGWPPEDLGLRAWPRTRGRSCSRSWWVLGSREEARGRWHGCAQSSLQPFLFFLAASSVTPPPFRRLWADVSLVSTLGARLHSFAETFVF